MFFLDTRVISDNSQAFNFVGIEGERIMGEVGCRLLERNMKRYQIFSIVNI